MNPDTRDLLDQLPGHLIYAFVGYWNRFEKRTQSIFDAKKVSQENFAELGKEVGFLTYAYPKWENALKPHWQTLKIEGKPILHDPYKYLLALDAEEWVRNLRAVKILPAAREALNNLLLELIEDVEIMIPSGFDEEDQIAIDSISSKRNHTIKSLFIRWERFTTEVQEGYGFTIYDYTNDLSIRLILQRVYDELQETGKMIFSESLHPLDERFRMSTNKTDSVLGLGDESHWWRYRIPKILLPELRQDFQTRGFI